MIVNLLFEIVYGPILEDGVAYVKSVFNKLSSSGETTQRKINECYEPPEFEFADRYASSMKIAAIVLVFSPAAPLIYFLGSLVLFVSFNIQKAALVKVYKKPRALDSQIASRSRSILYGLLWAKVLAASLFQVRQAFVSAHHSGVEVISTDYLPLLFSFGLLLVPVAWSWVESCCCRCCRWGRAEEEEDRSTGKPLRYQEACDETPAFVRYEPSEAWRKEELTRWAKENAKETWERGFKKLRTASLLTRLKKPASSISKEMI